jgi:hypothetical protein
VSTQVLRGSTLAMLASCTLAVIALLAAAPVTAQHAASTDAAQGARAATGSTDDLAEANAATGSGRASVTKVPAAPVIVPAGTPLAIELSANVGTRTSRIGDRVEARLANDLVVAGRIAAAAGANVTGSVTWIVPGGDGLDALPMLGLTFDSLVAKNGATVPIVARYEQQGTIPSGQNLAPTSGGEIKLRAGTIVEATTQTSFSIYQ